MLEGDAALALRNLDEKFQYLVEAEAARKVDEAARKATESILMNKLLVLESHLAVQYVQTRPSMPTASSTSATPTRSVLGDTWMPMGGPVPSDVRREGLAFGTTPVHSSSAYFRSRNDLRPTVKSKIARMSQSMKGKQKTAAVDLGESSSESSEADAHWSAGINTITRTTLPFANSEADNNLGLLSAADDEDVRASRKARKRRRRRKNPTGMLSIVVCGIRIRALGAQHPLVVCADVGFVLACTVMSMFAVTALASKIGNDPLSSYEVLSQVYIAAIMLFQLFTMCWVALRFFVRTRAGDWIIVDDLKQIRSMYLKSWFIFDLIYAVPLEILFVGWYDAAFYLILPRHFLRFIRVTSLISSPNPLSTFRKWYRFAAYLSMIAFIAHCFTLIFIAVANAYDGIGTDIEYIDALYWVVATLTSVGYGDVAVSSHEVRVLSIVYMTCGVVLISTFTAFATDFLTSSDTITEERIAKKNHMAAMLTHFNIPWKVQKEVIQVFPGILSNDTEKQFKESVGAMPSFVRDKLMFYFNAYHLKQVPLFREVAENTPELLLEVTKTMIQHIYPPYEYIVHQGDPMTEMYVIVHGTVEVTLPSLEAGGPDTYVATLSTGDWFGEQSVIAHKSVLTEMAVESDVDIASLTSVEVLVLAKEPMMRVLATCPDILDRLLGDTRKRKSSCSSKLDFQSAIVA